MKLIIVCMAFFTFLPWAKGESSVSLNELVSANTVFAFDLLNEVAKSQPGRNIFISPLSVSSVLQMVNNGAEGETRNEMMQTLGTARLPVSSLNAAFKELAQQFSGRSDVILNLASGLWYQEGFHMKSAFIDDNRKFFQAGLAGVDFETPQSAQEINAWADHQTKGKIKEVVSFPFPPLTRLILANAIYFKGTWTTPFKKNLTKPHEFHMDGGQSKQTPMMTQDGKFIYQENEGFQAIKLPYKGGLQMELYLPRANSTPQDMTGNFAGASVWHDKVQTGFSWREGKVTLPKFKVEYEVKLNQPLMALGMKSAFESGVANFSGIANEPLYIGLVKQKSYVDVNEEGTEAAAVTVVGVRAAGIMMPPPNRFTMTLDRSFFFVISDTETGSILFMGIVNDPVAGEGK